MLLHCGWLHVRSRRALGAPRHLIFLHVCLYLFLSQLLHGIRFFPGGCCYGAFFSVMECALVATVEHGRHPKNRVVFFLVSSLYYRSLGHTVS